MKITLTLAEAISYIRDHDALNHLDDAEIIIEGFENVPVVEAPVTEDKPKQKRKRRTKAELEAVTQDEVNELVSEVEAELETDMGESEVHAGTEPDDVIETTSSVQEEANFEEQQLSLIDEVLAEEVEVPLVEQEELDVIDTSAPLFG